MANIRRFSVLLFVTIIATSCKVFIIGANKETDTAEIENTPCDPQPEICDGIDNDCDGAIDNEASGATEWFFDRDQDGFGALLKDHNGITMGPILSCTKPVDCVTDSTDCDDDNSAVNPGAKEVCDEIDNDCDGGANDGNQAWYYDADEDGYGVYWRQAIESCTQPEGFVLDGTDCDDSDPAINPEAEETCKDKIDNDCNGTVDDCFHPA